MSKEVDMEALKKQDGYYEVVELVIADQLTKMEAFCLDVFEIDKKFFNAILTSYGSQEKKKFIGGS